jgi:hypothetical protein
MFYRTGCKRLMLTILVPQDNCSGAFVPDVRAVRSHIRSSAPSYDSMTTGSKVVTDLTIDLGCE